MRVTIRLSVNLSDVNLFRVKGFLCNFARLHEELVEMFLFPLKS